MESSPNGVMLVDQHGTIRLVNREIERLFGYPRAELLGQPIDLLVPTALRAGHPDLRASFLDNPRPRPVATGRDLSGRRRDGSEIPVEIALNPVHAEDGIFVLAIVIDISERKKADEERQASAAALRASERRYRTLIEDFPHGVIIHVRNSVVMANQACVALLGFERPEEIVGLSILDLTPPEERAAISALIGPLSSGFGQGYSFSSHGTQNPVLRRDGSVRWLAAHSKWIEWNGETAILSSLTDITEQRQAHHSLRESEDRFRQLVENIQVFVVLERPSRRPSYVSPNWQTFLGAAAGEPFPGPKFLSERIHPDDRARAWDQSERAVLGETSDITYRLTRLDGALIWVRSRLFPIRNADGDVYRTVTLLEDITAVRHTEEQLRQAQKMEAVGQLAAGIAHDFNNLLTAIIGCGEFLLEDLGPGHQSREDVSQLLAAAQSAAMLTRQLLTFSRRQLVQFQHVDLNETVARLGQLLRRTLGEHIAFHLALASGLARIYIDPGQIEQVVMNLAVNARDAMPDGGELTIRTANALIGPDRLATELPDGTRGTHVMLAVRDTGVGMDADTQRRMFEPFFTTKATGKGSGLGLATVYGIVEQSQGTIEVKSAHGKGSLFTVYLPVDPASVAEAAEGQPVAGAIRGTETVLLVEDEPWTRVAVLGMLKRQGYVVLEAGGADEALVRSRAHTGAIHLLLTDVVMPKSDGRRLAEALTLERPDMRVLYMSGYTDGALVEDFVLGEGVAFLAKPFTADVLARKLRAVLT